MRLNVRDWRVPLLVAVAFLFARLSGGRLPFFLFYVSAGLLLTTYLWAHRALRRTRCLVQIDTDRVEVGQQIKVKVQLDNATFLPLPWVEVDEGTPQDLVKTDKPRQATSVPLRGSRLLHFGLTAQRRGYYPVGPIRITLGDAFGLFRGQREFTSQLRITVYPRIHQMEGLAVPLSQPFGPVRTREKAFEDPSNQSGLREYRPGDNPRHIHWKTAARMGELMLREYELNATTQLLLFPDLCGTSQVGFNQQTQTSTEEKAIEIAASLAALGLRRKIDVGLICHGRERHAVGVGRGQRNFHEILEVLARAEAAGSLPIDQVVELEAAHLTNSSTLVIITPQLTAQLAALILRLRAKHQVMLVLLRRETFAQPNDVALDEAAATVAVPQGTSPLEGLLLQRKVAIYQVAAGDDLRRLADLRLTAGPEGVRVWPQDARPSRTRRSSLS